MNGLVVTCWLAGTAVGAVIDFDGERTIFFLINSLDRAYFKAVIILLAFFLVDGVRHTTSESV
jgi:hypothetical protein